MLNRSLFIRIDRLDINTIYDAIMIKEYIESCICFIAKKILMNNYYNNLDVRFQYSTYKIDNAFNIIEHFSISSISKELLNSIKNLCNLIEKNLEQTIDEFYMYNKLHSSILNINCMLVNNNNLLISYEIFPQLNNGEQF